MKVQQFNWKPFVPFFSLFVLFVLVGCGGPQDLFGGNNSKPDQSIPVQGHLIYTLSDKSLRAFYSITGTRAWDNNTSDTYQEALVTKNTVYAVSDKLYALDAISGRTEWSQPLSSGQMSMSNIGVDNQSVYIVSDSVAFSFNAKSGSIDWRAELQPPSSPLDIPDGGLVTPKPIIIVQDGILYTNNNDGSFVAALRTSDGKQMWSVKIPDDTSINSIAPSSYFQPVYNLVLHDGVLYAITYNDVVAIDIQNGSILWQAISGTVDSMVIVNNVMYVTVRGNVAGDPQSGSYQLWLANGKMSALKLPSGSVDFEHGYTNGTVYMIGGPTGGDIMAVQLTNSSTMWRSESTGVIDYLNVVGSNVYAVRDDGVISLLGGKDGKTIWSKTIPKGQGMNIQVDKNEIYSASAGQLTAFDVHSGNILWTANTGGDKTSFSSDSNGPLVFMNNN